MGFLDFLGGAGSSFFDLTPGGILDDLTGRRNMREQNDWNFKMWNLQNEYNTPKAQMARFAEAGLNPNLIYGQASSGNAGSLTSASARGLSGALGSISSAFQTAMALKQFSANLNNVRAQNSLIHSQRSVAEANARRINYETEWLKKHGTSSFDSSTIRAGKSLLDYAQPVADSVGRYVGSVIGNAFYNRPVRLVPRGDSYHQIRYRLMH